MGYLKKEQILQLEDYQLVNEFENTVTECIKAINFTKRGVTPKLAKQLDWLREEILSRMK